MWWINNESREHGMKDERVVVSNQAGVIPALTIPGTSSAVLYKQSKQVNRTTTGSFSYSSPQSTKRHQHISKLVNYRARLSEQRLLISRQAKYLLYILANRQLNQFRSNQLLLSQPLPGDGNRAIAHIL
jgi:hypothetical protein